MNHEWIVFGIGTLLIVFSLFVTTGKDFPSRFVFKIVPFFSGLYLMWYAARILDFI